MQNRLREIRKELGLTLQQLADIVGTSNQQIQRLESGERRLSDHWISRISEALKLEPYALIADPKTIIDEGDRELISRFSALTEEGKKNVWHAIEMEEFKNRGERE